MKDLPGLDQSPYQRFLGVWLTRAEDGLVEIRLPFREEFLRLDGSDWLHGGIVSAFIDTAGAYAMATKTGVPAPTIDLRIDYLQPARRGELVALARVFRLGRTVGVADVEVRNTSGELVAVGRGTYAAPKAEETD